MARPSKHDGAVFKRNDGKILWITYRNREGKRIRESTFTEDWQEAQRKLRERLQARDDKLLEIVRKGEQLQFSTWVDFFLENYSQPPLRAEKTHEANLRAGLHLKKAFGARKLGEVSADDIKVYLLRRLQDRVRIKTGAGVVLREKLKRATVHQELRILRRILNMAVRKKLLPSNPCAGVEFPVAVKGLFRPHYMGWAEQQIEFQAPEYLRNIIRIITETGLRVYKELSAGGVADEWVTQLLRQGDAKVFKKHSQMKLQMKREALQKLNRQANESGRSFDTERPN